MLRKTLSQHTPMSRYMFQLEAKMLICNIEYGGSSEILLKSKHQINSVTINFKNGICAIQA